MQLADTADEEGTIRNCLAVSYNPTLCVAVRVVRPELQITKTGPTQAMVCDDLVYVYTVTNSGTGTARSVRLEDALPEGLTTENGGRVVTADLGDIQQGERKEARVKLKASRPGRFASRAVARSGNIEVRTRELVTELRQPVLAVSVEGPEAQYVGEAINYRVTVRNTGDGEAAKTVVRLSAAGATERVADRDLGTIQPGEGKTFPVTLRAGRGAGEVRLTAVAEAVCAKEVSDVAAVAVRTIAALQLECVDSTDPVQVGANSTYTINVRNEGSGPESNVRVRATLPPELQYVGAKGTTQVNAQGQQLTFGPVGTLPAGQFATWTIEVKAQQAGDARFRVELNSDSLDQPAVETEPTRVIE